jgi:hypothetical protein
MVTTPFMTGLSTRDLFPNLAIGISMRSVTMVAVKLSGGAAKAGIPAKQRTKITHVIVTNLVLIIITISSLGLKQ